MGFLAAIFGPKPTIDREGGTKKEKSAGNKQHTVSGDKRQDKGSTPEARKPVVRRPEKPRERGDSPAQRKSSPRISADPSPDKRGSPSSQNLRGPISDERGSRNPTRVLRQNRTDTGRGEFGRANRLNEEDFVSVEGGMPLEPRPRVGQTLAHRPVERERTRSSHIPDDRPAERRASERDRSQGKGVEERKRVEERMPERRVADARLERRTEERIPDRMQRERTPDRRADERADDKRERVPFEEGDRQRADGFGRPPNDGDRRARPGLNDSNIRERADNPRIPDKRPPIDWRAGDSKSRSATAKNPPRRFSDEWDDERNPNRGPIVHGLQESKLDEEKRKWKGLPVNQFMNQPIELSRFSPKGSTERDAFMFNNLYSRETPSQAPPQMTSYPSYGFQAAIRPLGAPAPHPLVGSAPHNPLLPLPNFTTPWSSAKNETPKLSSRTLEASSSQHEVVTPIPAPRAMATPPTVALRLPSNPPIPTHAAIAPQSRAAMCQTNLSTTSLVWPSIEEDQEEIVRPITVGNDSAGATAKIDPPNYPPASMVQQHILQIQHQQQTIQQQQQLLLQQQREILKLQHDRQVAEFQNLLHSNSNNCGELNDESIIYIQ